MTHPPAPVHPHDELCALFRRALTALPPLPPGTPTEAPEVFLATVRATGIDPLADR